MEVRLESYKQNLINTFKVLALEGSYQEQNTASICAFILCTEYKEHIRYNTHLTLQIYLYVSDKEKKRK
jgi:hypothetical protein